MMKNFFKIGKLNLKRNTLFPLQRFFITFKNSAKLSQFNNFNITQKKLFNEKIKLKDKIQIIDSEDVNDEIEDWGELIAMNLEKENYVKFHESLKYLKDKNIILNLDEINKIFSLVYNKNIKALDTIYNYVCDKNIQLDSISYYYLVAGYLQYKTFQQAFDFFLQGSLFNIPQNLSIVVYLYKELANITNEEERLKFHNIIEAHVKKYYPDDVLELLEGLNSEFNKKEGFEVDLEGEIKQFTKVKKSKKSKTNLNENNYNNGPYKKPTEVNKSSNENKNEGKEEDLNVGDKETAPIVNPTNNEGLNNFQQSVNTIPENNESKNISENVSKKSISPKKKEKKSKKHNHDTGLENLFGSNRGIIVITQPLLEDSDDDGSQSD